MKNQLTLKSYSNVHTVSFESEEDFMDNFQQLFGEANHYFKYSDGMFYLVSEENINNYFNSRHKYPLEVAEALDPSISQDKSRDHSTEYQNREFFEDFHNYLNHCFNNWREPPQEGGFYSPTVPLIQGSGTGKTRTLLELSTVEVLIMINCEYAHGNNASGGLKLILKNLPDTMKPKDSPPSVAGLIYRDSTNMYASDVKEISETCQNVLSATVAAAAQFIDIYIENKVASHQDPTEDQRLEYLREATIILANTTYDNRAQIEFWESVERFCSLSESRLTEDIGNLKNWPLIRRKKFVFGFDEASGLFEDQRKLPIEKAVSPFYRGLRKAFCDPLTKPQNICECLAVFSGTNAKLGNFYPINKVDRSPHYCPSRKATCFPYDLLYNDTMEKAYVEDLMKSNLFEVLKHPREAGFYKLGRAFWSKVYIDVADNRDLNRKIEDVITFISRRLYPELPGENAPAEQLMDMRWVPVIMALVPFSAYLPADMQDYLVYSAFGTFTGLSSIFHRIQVFYPIEPLISVGAARVLRNDIDGTIKKSMFRYFRGILEKQDAGNRGELAVFMMVMESMFTATNYRTDQTITVKDFLKAFLGSLFDQACDLVTNKDILSNKMSLSKIARFTSELTPELLKECLIRGVAFIGSMLTAGFDLCIPMVCPDGTISSIFIEVKNAQKLDSENVKTKISHFKAKLNDFPNSLLLIINLSKATLFEPSISTGESYSKESKRDNILIADNFLWSSDIAIEYAEFVNVEIEKDYLEIHGQSANYAYLRRFTNKK